MAAAARAFEWHTESVALDVKLRRGIDGLYGAGAPPEVNPLLLPFVLADVERARTGHDPSVVTRPQLRRYLADAVPPGRQGQRRSFLPERVANAKEHGWSDEMVMNHFGIASPGAIRVLLSQAKKRKPRPTATVSDIHPKLLTPAAAPTLVPTSAASAERSARKKEPTDADDHRPETQPTPPEVCGVSVRLPAGRPPATQRNQRKPVALDDRPRRGQSHPTRKDGPGPEK